LGEAEGSGEEIDKLILRVEQVAIYLCKHVEGILAQGRFDRPFFLLRHRCAMVLLVRQPCAMADPTVC
jgi:hypothetical protein